MLKQTLIGLSLLGVILYGTACADAASVQDTNDRLHKDVSETKVLSSVVSSLLDYNFYPGMSNLDVYYIGGTNIPEGSGRTLYIMMEARLKNECPDREFTEKEKWQLGVKALPDGGYDSLSMLYSDLVSYHRAYGGLPANGVEFFPELAESKNLREFTALSEQEKYVRYRHGINPITGKFYSFFIDSNWSPGGIVIKFITNPDEIKQKYPHAVIPIDPTKEHLTKNDVTSVAEVWEITVYGEEEDTVLCNSVLFT